MLEIVGRLVEATANEKIPQLPRDINTANEIITKTLDLLFKILDTTARHEMHLTMVYFMMF